MLGSHLLLIISMVVAGSTSCAIFVLLISQRLKEKRPITLAVVLGVLVTSAIIWATYLVLTVKYAVKNSTQKQIYDVQIGFTDRISPCNIGDLLPGMEKTCRRSPSLSGAFFVFHAQKKDHVPYNWWEGLDGKWPKGSASGLGSIANIDIQENWHWMVEYASLNQARRTYASKDLRQNESAVAK